MGELKKKKNKEILNKNIMINNNIYKKIFTFFN